MANVHQDVMDKEVFQKLARRMGDDHLRKRLIRQVTYAAKFYAKGGFASFHLENAERLPMVLKFLLKALNLYRRGQQNSLDYRVEKVRVLVKRLPPEFNGFRILQLSDVHADGIPDGARKLISKLARIKADLCALTGDFRFLTQDFYTPALRKTAEIARAVDAPFGIWGILGNHDFIEFVPELENAGIQMLLNESAPISKNGARIWLAGIDDAHLYDCHDIKKACADIPAHAVRILLSHTPETYKEAADAGFDYVICGHTHGGQICLPGGIPVMVNARCPRRFCTGLWRYQGLQGYTSRATGSSGLSVRFFCPPEITIHELARCED